MITPEMLQQTPGDWYIDTRLNSSSEFEVTLDITAFMSKCLYWHEGKRMWSTDGCMVSFHLDIKSDKLGCLALALHVQ